MSIISTDVRIRTWVAVLAAVCWLLNSAAAADVRIKDITDIEGIRTNQLLGLGLVTGLNGTGSKSPLTRQLALNLVERLGVRADPTLRAMLRNDSQERTDNLSVVTVTANLPPFVRKGQTIDVTVATLDNATSLQGGILILAPLTAVDGEVYAVASGAISIGGFSFSGQAAQVQKNHPTTALIPNGATIERETCTTIAADGIVRLLLKNPDYETARRMAEAIQARDPGCARVKDLGTVEVLVPEAHLAEPAAFLAMIGELRIQPDMRAVVVVDERTGTVVIGDNVRLSRVLITHANLSVTTGEFPQVSQPAPFSEGETVVVPRTQLDVTEETAPVSVFEETTTVGDLARALNSLGVTPRDLSSIFQQLKASGSLHAELILR